jgi:hypothetical protein
MSIHWGFLTFVWHLGPFFKNDINFWSFISFQNFWLEVFKHLGSYYKGRNVKAY